jgi:hypothetical protein
MQRRGKHITVIIEELLGKGVFYVVHAEMLYAGQFEATSLEAGSNTSTVTLRVV